MDTKRNMKKGEVVTENDVHLLSPGDGFQWVQKNEVLGKVLTQDVPADEVIYKEMLF